MRRTKEEAEKTKQKIMLAALAIFNKKGYANTTYTDIAKAADVTRGAIYHHFFCKSDILKEIAIHHKDNINQIIEKRINQNCDSPKQTFNNVIKILLEKLSNDAFFRDFEELKLKTNLTGELVHLKSFFDKEFQVGVKHLHEYLRRCQKVGTLRKDININAYSIAIAAGITGVLELYTRYNDYLDIEKNLPEVCEYLLYDSNK